MQLLKASHAAKKIPFFPVIPLVPLALFIANAFALATLFRRVRRIEARSATAT
jgi:hypothetical protein